MNRTNVLRSNFGSILILYLNAGFSLVGEIAGRMFAARIGQGVPPIPRPTYNSSTEAP